MSVYDLYQSYLDQMQQSPIMQSPVMENPLYNLLLLQQQQGGDGFSNMAPYSDPNVGPGFQDYEAQAYGIGNTVRGSLAGMIDAYSKMPTPMNLAMRGIRAIGNMFGGQGPAMGPAFSGTPSQMAALASEYGGGFSDGTSSAADGGEAGAAAASAAGANDGPGTGGSF